MTVSARQGRSETRARHTASTKETAADLETLVLQHLLDRYLFTGGDELGLVDDTKGAISDDLVVGVGDISRRATLAVVGGDGGDPRGIVNG